MNNVVVGGDFEGFVRLNNDWIPAERVLGGGKDSPITLGKGVVGHPDNVMAEFALAAPVPVETFSARVKTAMDMLREHINPAEFIPRSSLKFNKEWLDDAKMSKEVGCMPDFDSHGNMYQYGHDTLGLYRYAGFHIHFDVVDSMPADYAVRVVDCTIGLASIALGWDMQGNRRQFYGTAGRHRPKFYGVEYRTLSSNVLNHLDELQEILVPVCHALSTGHHPIIALPQIMWDPVSSAINTEDRDLARTLWGEVVKHV